MEKKIYFQSSMPRAGSTLLQNIMGQNPEFYVTPTSGVLDLLYSGRMAFTNGLEFKAQDPNLMNEAFKSFCKNGLLGFFNGVTDKPYVLDKSRGWGIHYNFLNEFYPNPKIIVMVRDLRAIYASMEKIHRKNSLNNDPIINHSTLQGTTTAKRIQIWGQSQPVGLALERINEMLVQGIAKNVLFVRFEDFTSNPQGILNSIYNYLEVPNFTHDTENVIQLTQEDDAVYGLGDLHSIKKSIKPLKNDYEEVLTKGLSDMIYENNKWYFKAFNYEK